MAAKPELYSIDDFEQYASDCLPKMVRDYFNGGALDSITVRGNLDQYRAWYIRPRVLRDVSKMRVKTKVFPGGNDIPFPCKLHFVPFWKGDSSYLDQELCQ